MEETVKERTVTEEIKTQFFRDSKNTVSVGTGNEFAGHGKRPVLIVFITTGRTEPAFASEWRKLEITAMRASKHGTAIGWISTMNHLLDVFNNNRSRMESILNFFVIISKNVLEYIHKTMSGEEYKSEKNIIIHPTCNKLDRITERFAWSAPSSKAVISPLMDTHEISGLRQQELWAFYCIYYNIII